jgi:hypothetical protein
MLHASWASTSGPQHSACGAPGLCCGHVMRGHHHLAQPPPQAVVPPVAVCNMLRLSGGYLCGAWPDAVAAGAVDRVQGMSCNAAAGQFCSPSSAGIKLRVVLLGAGMCAYARNVQFVRPWFWGHCRLGCVVRRAQHVTCSHLHQVFVWEAGSVQSSLQRLQCLPEPGGGRSNSSATNYLSRAAVL